MKNNLIPFPVPCQIDDEKGLTEDEKEVSLAQSDRLIALRAAFDQARTKWVIEIAELPENNKIYSSSKK
ncbi:hypothetical protein [Marinomonas algarum]|uniref:Uncharacterized protein n=1 Tax=Marinomonas algarum TaxID=2883105 RepID=A0A9X1IPP8_9GAMM|nr:hypothetical protein [Marinomonas algarum]MCB5162902.1 hypothetical protein [Marinomonas algarum]